MLVLYGEEEELSNLLASIASLTIMIFDIGVSSFLLVE